MAVKGKARAPRDASNFTEKLLQPALFLPLFNPTITLGVVTESVWKTMAFHSHARPKHGTATQRLGTAGMRQPAS